MTTIIPHYGVVHIESGPEDLFIFWATNIACIVFMCIALINLCTFFRRNLTPQAMHAIGCRLLTAQYILFFMAALWALSLSVCIRHCIEALLTMIFGDALKGVLLTYAGMPVYIAWGLLAMTGIHGILSVAFAIRKNKSNE